MRDQLLTLVWLRFTLLRHTMTAGKAASMILAALALLAALVLALALGVGLFFAGWSSSNAWMVLGITDGCVLAYLVVWCFMLIQEIQRSEIIDFRKMLYLPISPRMVFLLNYAASLFSASLFLFVLPLTGLTLGLTVRFGWPMLFVYPIGLAFYLMLSSWVYYVRGLLAIMMENKRRRRVILTLVPFAFILLAQTPNLINVAFLNRNHAPGTGNPQRGQAQPPHMPDFLKDSAQVRGAVAIMNAVIPLGWLPYGAYALVERRFFAAGASLAGIGLLTACGLGLGFRSTLRYYTGKSRATARAAARPEQPATDLKKRPFVMRSLPFVDEQTSAMAVASLRMYLRHPQMYIMVLSPLIMGFVISFVMISSSQAFGQNMIPLLVIVLPVFGFAHLLLNLFGTDRAGFRALILLPTPRHKYLLGRNLALLPLVGGITSLLILLCAILIKPLISVSIASILQALQLYLLFCIIGNFVSVYFPYRIAWEGMRRADQSGWGVLIAIVLSLTLPGTVVAVALACRWIDSGLAIWWRFPIPLFTLLGAVTFLLALAILYRLSLPLAGNLMLRREQQMLNHIVRDRE